MNVRERQDREKDKFRHLYRVLFSLVLVALETWIFFHIWTKFYNPNLRVPYYFRGNYFVSFIYAILMLVFSNIYGGLKIGYYRTLTIILSLSVTAAVANAVAYITIVIPAATWYLSPVPAVIFMTLLDIAVIVVWSLFSNRLFGKLFPPQKLLLVYGSGTDDIAAKFGSRKDRYDIAGRIQAEEVKGKANLAPVFAVCENYDGVIIGDISAEARNDILKYCYSHFVRTYTLPKLTDVILKSSETLHIFDSPMFLNRNHGLTIGQLFMKRLSDIAISLIGILLTSPILLLTALLIKLEDGGPVLFTQERCTTGGRVFQIYKFRSMVVDADRLGTPMVATKGDPRITRVGRIIRPFRIDELPQLFNILKGDMSVVGPRPERIENVRAYTEEIPEFPYRMLVKGGLTGYAQVYGKYNTSAYDKLKLDLMYIQNYSFFLDLEIIFKTLQIILTKESAEGFDAEASQKLENTD